MASGGDVFSGAKARLDIFLLEIAFRMSRRLPVEGDEPALGTDNHFFTRDLSFFHQLPQGFADGALAAHAAVIDGRIDEIDARKQGRPDRLDIKGVVPGILAAQ